jgi:hypothetical protein
MEKNTDEDPAEKNAQEIVIDLNFTHSPYFINIKLTSSKTTVNYAPEFDYDPQDSNFKETFTSRFKQLAELDRTKNAFASSAFRFYDSTARVKSFIFHTIHSTNSSKTKISPGLFDSLFNRNKPWRLAHDTEILMIGTSDGHVFWFPLNLNSSSKASLPQSLNETELVYNPTSPIIYMNSFRNTASAKRSPFDALLSEAERRESAKSLPQIPKSEDNGLFVVTKCGRVHVFSYGSESAYNCCLMYENVEVATKFTDFSGGKTPVDYLVFCSTENSVYSLRLSDCVGKAEVSPSWICGGHVNSFLTGKV